MISSRTAPRSAFLPHAGTSRELHRSRDAKVLRIIERSSWGLSDARDPRRSLQTFVNHCRRRTTMIFPRLALWHEADRRADAHARAQPGRRGAVRAAHAE